ncbi:helix-turn-helix transcriptional regulator [Oryzihumus leptocrescens]|uniref:Excisionase family DNA binding protein n=1 Tax=Oryzihumus leptocrescens TaxID=297536 RepID=A0A542ZEM7_9MICO|nr:helix-turn-helix domain-containing protein [Oryzihumus leptocrescens]TQL58739.1 excisionase family DNA binding protein [Oryzihumus leptocrescens]
MRKPTTSTPVPRLLTATEVADILRLSISTVRALTIRGDIPCRRLAGRSIRYTDADLHAYIAASSDDGLAA